MNNYEVAEIIELGRAQDVILGSSKFVPNVDDGIDQPRRQTSTEDDE